jgi:methionyl-tRNA synthetase
MVILGPYNLDKDKYLAHVVFYVGTMYYRDVLLDNLNYVPTLSNDFKPIIERTIKELSNNGVLTEEEIFSYYDVEKIDATVTEFIIRYISSYEKDKGR